MPTHIRVTHYFLAIWLLFATAQGSATLAAQNDQRALAIQLTNEGGRAYNAGQYDRAITLWQRSLEVFQGLNDARGVAGALANLGLVSNRLGQKKRAVDYYNRALDLLDENHPSLLANVLKSLGSLAVESGQASEGLRYLNRSLEINKALNDRDGVIDSLDGLAYAYLLQKQWDRALANQEQILALVRQKGELREIARVMGNIGATGKGKGDYNLATRYLEEALKLKRQFATSEDLAGSLSNLALIYHDQKKLPNSAAAFSESILINEMVSQQVREASKVGEFQSGMRASMYRRYAHCLIDQGKPEEALVALERGRSQGLGRQAAQNRADYSRFLGPADAARLKAALATLTAAGEAMRQTEGLAFIADGAGDSPAKRQILLTRRRYEDAEQQLAALRAQLAARSPAYRLRSGASPTTLAELKDLAAKNPDTLYLQWAIGAEATSLLFALSQKSGVQSFVLNAGEDIIRKQVAALRKAVEDQDTGLDSLASRVLYDNLFGAVEKAGLLAPGQFSRLVLVGDGPLLSLPYAALRNAKNERLIERFPIAVSGSFGVLTWPDERSKADSPLFVIADPTAPGSPPLPAARAEGQSVAALFPGSKLLVGGAAVRQQVTPQLGKFSILHFATHGAFDGEEGLRSGILLASDRGSQDIQLLEARELVNLQLAAQLAVLSACDTGQGQKSGGEGLLGLTWAFRAAGCPSVVASLWSVDDAATGQLMVRFYEGLKAGKRKDDALRDAILEVKKTKSAPFYWAPFQVNGEAGAMKL